MENSKKVTAIIGTYRRGGMIDTAVGEILNGAEQEGADANRIYLTEKHIEFCRNCRTCTQEKGPGRGGCCIREDEMEAILAQLEASDAIVLASPINFWTVTAVMKRFIERLVCLAYWPWGAKSPRLRNKHKTKKAVIVLSSAAPSLLARLMTGSTGLLKTTAGLLGAKVIGVLFIGFSAQKERQELSERMGKKARSLGRRLIQT